MKKLLSILTLTLPCLCVVAQPFYTDQKTLNNNVRQSSTYNPGRVANALDALADGKVDWLNTVQARSVDGVHYVANLYNSTTGYDSRQRYTLQFQVANTGSADLKFVTAAGGNLAVIPLVKAYNTPLVANDIAGNKIYDVFYDGHSFQVSDIPLVVGGTFDSSMYYTKTKSDARYLRSYTETDPVWVAAMPNYYTKTQSDSRYLQSFTETDPVYVAGITNYYNKTQSDARYLQSYTETDPIYTAGIVNYYNKTISDGRFYPLSSNPSGYLTSYTESDPIWTAASVNYYTKTLSDGRFYPLSSNPAGYLTSYTETDPIWTAASINYYTKTQSDSRYLQSYTETDPLFDTKFAAKTTTNLTEGSNLYYTTARFNTAFGTKSTTDLSEGTNLYYTAARFNTAFAAKSTTDLAEGSNLYFTNIRFDVRFNTDFAAKTTDGLGEGTTNLYYTNARFDTRFGTKTTDNLTEGSTNLYYTTARFDSRLATKTTDNLTEGATNKYYTDARARGAISLTTTGVVGAAATYNNTTGVLNIPTPAYTAGTGINISSGVVTNTLPDQTVTLTPGNGITITGTYPNFTISAIAPTITSPSRTLGTSFTISSTKYAVVFYSVNCQVTNPLLVGTTTATCYLEYSTNGGTSYNPVTQIANSSGVGVTVTVALTNGQTGVLCGIIPANGLTRIRAVNSSGSATTTIVSTYEVVF